LLRNLALDVGPKYCVDLMREKAKEQSLDVDIAQGMPGI